MILSNVGESIPIERRLRRHDVLLPVGVLAEQLHQRLLRVLDDDLLRLNRLSYQLAAGVNGVAPHAHDHVVAVHIHADIIDIQITLDVCG